MKFAFFLLFAWSLPICAQDVKTGSIETRGTCSPVVIQPREGFTIHCDTAGLSAQGAKRQADQYAEILNRIRQNALDLNVVMGALNSIGNDIKDIKVATAARHLSQSQRQIFELDMKSFKGTKITIASPMGDAEADDYASDFTSALKAAGFVGFESTERVQALFTSAPHGLALLVNDDDYERNKVPPQCPVFANTALRVGVGLQLVVTRSVPSGSCELVVGSK